MTLRTALCVRMLVAVVALALSTTLLAGCGNSGSAAPPPATVAPMFFPTEPPVPTPTVETPYEEYLTWKGGMSQVSQDMNRAFQAIVAGEVDMQNGNTDPNNFEGHLQDARDALSDAQDAYGSLSAPPGFGWIQWSVGKAIDSYQNGVNTIDRGIANGDTATIEQGVGQFRQGDSDLQRINTIARHQAWLLWKARTKKNAIGQSSGSA